MVLFLRCFIDPCQACVVGGLILFAHCLQVCVLDIMTFLSNKALKPLLHVVYESCIYPFCVCMRVTLDAINICLEPMWIMAYRAVRLPPSYTNLCVCVMRGSRSEIHSSDAYILLSGTLESQTAVF